MKSMRIISSCQGVTVVYLTVKVTLSAASSSVLWSSATTRSSSTCVPGLTPFNVPLALSNMPDQFAVDISVGRGGRVCLWSVGSEFLPCPPLWFDP